MFKRGEKVTTGFGGVEGFFLSESDGNATVLKREYAFLGLWKEYTDEILECVPVSELKLVEDDNFYIAGYYHYEHGTVVKLSSEETLERLKGRDNNTYFVSDYHTNSIYFCGLGMHLPTYLYIMKKHWGLRDIKRDDIPKWTKITDEHFLFYNGAVHNPEHYAWHLPKRFRF